MTQVQLFDTFYTDFEKVLRQIHAENPDSELLLNLSSGTPAMKSALNVISVLSPFPMRAIQVSTPNQRENPKYESPMDYDVEAYWECNQDNEPDFPNRCLEVQSEHLLVKIKRKHPAFAECLRLSGRAAFGAGDFRLYRPGGNENA